MLYIYPIAIKFQLTYCIYVCIIHIRIHAWLIASYIAIYTKVQVRTTTSEESIASICSS